MKFVSYSLLHLSSVYDYGPASQVGSHRHQPQLDATWSTWTTCTVPYRVHYPLEVEIPYNTPRLANLTQTRNNNTYGCTKIPEHVTLKGLMASTQLPQHLHITGTSASDGALAFGGINLGNINYGDTMASKC